MSTLTGPLRRRPAWARRSPTALVKYVAQWDKRSPTAALAGGFVLYLTVALYFFGAPLLRDPWAAYVGNGPDPQVFIWALGWWPYALGHGLDPFTTHLISAPFGADVTYTSSVPGASLLALPVTLTLGPIVAWNLLMVFAPALSATAAFALCRELTGRTTPALIGGYLFGFSSFVISQTNAHLHMTFLCAVPLSALAVIRYLRGRCSPRRFVATLAALLLVQFLFSAEIFATMTLFGAAAIGLGLLAFPERRREIRTLIGLSAAAYVIALTIAAPLAWHMLKHQPHGQINPPSSYSTDLLNLVVPTPSTAFGGPALASLSAKFSGSNISERDAYLGLPLIIMISLAVWAQRRERSMRVLAALLGLSVLAALGPTLHVAGADVLPLPYGAVDRLPLLANVVPARFSMFTALTAAVIAAIALRRRHGSREWALAVVVICSLLPNLARSGWQSAATGPKVLSVPALQGKIARGSTVFIIPYGWSADTMRWQAEDHYRFRLAGGATTPVSSLYSSSAAVRALNLYHVNRVPLLSLRRLLIATHTATLLIWLPRDPYARDRLRHGLHYPCRDVADAVLCKVSPADPANSHQPGALRTPRAP